MPKIQIRIWNTPPEVLALQALADKIRSEPKNFPNATPADKNSFMQAIQYRVAQLYRIEPGDVSVKARDRLLSRSHVSPEVKEKKLQKGERPVYIGSAPIWIRIETSMTAVCKKTVRRIVREEMVKISGNEVYLLISAEAMERCITNFCDGLLNERQVFRVAGQIPTNADYEKFSKQLKLMAQHAQQKRAAGQ